MWTWVMWKHCKVLKSAFHFLITVMMRIFRLGACSRVVILSPVRSRKQFLEADKQRSRGLVMEPRRLCVSLTRAKELLIVVGNAQVRCKRSRALCPTLMRTLPTASQRK